MANEIDTIPADGMPDTDMLLRRAHEAARVLYDAREAHAGGTTALVTAYGELADEHRATQAELAARDAELHRCETDLARKDVEAAELGALFEAAQGEISRLGDEVARSAEEARRLGDVAREAMAATRAVQAERDEVRTAHDTLSQQHRRLSMAFQELIAKVGQDARNLSDEGRRITGIVPAGPRVRPAPLRSAVNVPDEVVSAVLSGERRATDAARLPPPPAPVARQVPAAVPAQAVAPVPAPQRTLPPASPAPQRHPFPPVEPAGYTGVVENDIAQVLTLSLQGRGVPADNDRSESPADEPSPREDMSDALSGFGSLKLAKSA